jgi:ankyrin repeat protein
MKNLSVWVSLAVSLIFLALCPELLENELFASAVDGGVSSVNRLLAAGIDPNTPHWERGDAITGAADAGQDKTLNALLRAGGDPNSTSDEGFDSPLMLAAQRDNVKCIRDLLLAGADPNFDNGFGVTALSLAHQWHDPVAISLLKQHGEKK